MPKRKSTVAVAKAESTSAPVADESNSDKALTQSNAATPPTDVELFKNLLAIKRGDDVQARFNAIAEYLLNHTLLLCGPKVYRLVEIEFYMVADDHQDCYTHKAPEQTHPLMWYFHRTVPGIDLTFGGGHAQFGGILLRSVEDISNNLLIEGTANILGLACRDNGCCSKEALAPLLPEGHPATDDARLLSSSGVPAPTTGKAETAGKRAPRAPPPKAPVQLVLIHDRTRALEEKKVISCPRASLGVKNTSGLDKYRFLMAHYRFMTETRDIKSAKPNIVLGLRAKGWDAATIAAATGCKLETVEKYIGLLRHKGRALEEFQPCRSLLLEDYCALYQLIHSLPL